jgi:hypothetical protein
MKWAGNLFAMVETPMDTDLGIGDFVDDCDELIYEGWFVHGSPIQFRDGDSIVICQAFVRRASHASGHKD